MEKTLREEKDTIYTSKTEQYIVTVAVQQAKQLAGIEIDPFCEVRIGQQSKRTKTKKNTNDPVFEESYVFEFEMPPAVFFEQLVTLEVIRAGRLLSRDKTIGTFKIDIATVYEQPEHMFFHRWAVLVDYLKPLSGPKGYLCCDIMVSKKGTLVRIPNISDIDEDIEANLLLPDAVAESTVERLPAKYYLGVHSAQGLPNLRGTAFASVREKLTGKPPIDLIDPFIQVTFAGLTGKTRVRRDTNNPIWNEQIIFTELFPPLIRAMRVHVRDNGGKVVGTTFLDLNYMCDNNIEGYMPTFGPAFLNLYGAIRGTEEISPLNFGLDEGVSHRGRLLLSLRVELDEYVSKKGMRHVEIKNVLPLPDNITGPQAEYFLFCCIHNADMIDKRLAGRPLSFEISIGTLGSTEPEVGQEMLEPDSISLSSTVQMSDIADEAEQEPFPEGKRWKSKTTPMKASAKDDYYCFIPFGSRKPCMSIYSVWEDQRQRMFHANYLKRLHELFDSFLIDVARLMEMDQLKDAVKRIKMGIDLLGSQCNEYLSYLMGMPVDVDSPFATKLDREKHGQRMREIQSMIDSIAVVRRNVTPTKLYEAYPECLAFADKLKLLSTESQETIPDIFLWLKSGNRRVAYQRFKPEDLLFSENEEERGRYCGKQTTFFLKMPGRVQEAESYEIFGQITSFFWLGLRSQMKDYMDGMPGGYTQSVRNKDPTSRDYSPPIWINYSKTAHVYELRCHIFQGRSLMPADESGLSDPFVRVLFKGHALQTQVIEQTVNPLWDECLILPAIRLFGHPINIEQSPPKIILQVYDQDEDGTYEFMGRAEAFPNVKLAKQRYEKPRFPPLLEWVPIYKGRYRVGEVLACFELLQLTKDMRDYPTLPPLPQTGDEDLRREMMMPIPPSIRPRLAAFRVEAMFYGLRNLKAPGIRSIERPRVEIEMCSAVIKSKPLSSYKKLQNFTDMVEIMDVLLPENPLYRPPMTIRCMDSKQFGRSVLIGTHIVGNIDPYLVEFTPEVKTTDDHSVVIDMDDEHAPLIEDGSVVSEERSHISSTLPTTESRNLSSMLQKELDVDEEGYFVTNDPGELNEAYETSEGEEEGDEYVDDFPSMPFPPMMVGQKTRAQKTESDYYARSNEASSPFTRTDTATPYSTSAPTRTDITTPYSGESDRQSSRASTVIEIDRRSGPRSAMNGSVKSGSRAGSRVGSKIGSKLGSHLSLKSKKEDEVGLTAVQEVTIEEEDDSEYLGSTKPLPVEKEVEEDDDGKKKKKKEPAMVFDWWSKFYASQQDLEEERRAERDKFKEKRKKTASKAGMALKKGFLNFVDKAYDMKEKMTTKDDKDKQRDVLPVRQQGVTVDADKSLIERMKIYPSELETQLEFGGFRDRVIPFRLYRGKKTFSVLDEITRFVGTFKGNIRISKLEGEAELEMLGGIERDQNQLSMLDKPMALIGGAALNTYVQEIMGRAMVAKMEIRPTFTDLPVPDPVPVTVRVYVIRANKLKPCDSSGKADPYLVVTLGKHKINRKAMRHNNQLNPIFGEFFQFDVTFPRETELRVQIWDYDRVSSDDLMGETRLDLEQRWLTKHRGTCGLPNKYDTKGYCAWLDYKKPSTVLAGLCVKHNLRGPFYKPGSVRIGDKTFTAPLLTSTEGPKGKRVKVMDSENVALWALRHWQDMPDVGCELIPEHVENRPLYLPDVPGIVQGSVDMFVHIFPTDQVTATRDLSITPRKPKTYELRVIIWDTKKVPLDDVNVVTGNASVDQFLKGYIIGPEHDLQQTDVHYRSMSGDGNFNWRFVWRFKYLDAEEKIVYKSKLSFYSLAEHEEKIAPRLNLEVWDADTFSGDDYIGTLVLDLCHLLRGSRGPGGCNLETVDATKNLLVCNLFRQKRIRGWWPFQQVDSSGKAKLAGIVDCELNLMTEEDAEARPVGLGREPPEPMQDPVRPETSFSWWSNPLKFLKYSVWEGMKYKCMVGIAILLLLAFVGAFIYTLPEAVMQRMVLGGNS